MKEYTIRIGNTNINKTFLTSEEARSWGNWNYKDSSNFKVVLVNEPIIKIKYPKKLSNCNCSVNRSSNATRGVNKEPICIWKCPMHGNLFTEIISLPTTN